MQSTWTSRFANWAKAVGVGGACWALAAGFSAGQTTTSDTNQTTQSSGSTTSGTGSSTRSGSTSKDNSLTGLARLIEARTGSQTDQFGQSGHLNQAGQHDQAGRQTPDYPNQASSSQNESRIGSNSQNYSGQDQASHTHDSIGQPRDDMRRSQGQSAQYGHPG